MVFEKMGSMQHEQVVFCHDPAVGLKAIIAIHDTTLGPALGGCRMWDYSSEGEAIEDVLRLSRGMTYKAAVAGLNLGGGKAVIMGPTSLKSEGLFRAFGRFVQNLNGRYITAEDVNISVADIEAVAVETQYVTGTKSQPGASGDPSPVTAIGVFSGIRAAVRQRLGKDSLQGIRVGVQGCGKVGSYLCELLAGEGAKLFISDIDANRCRTLAEKFGAEVVENRRLIGSDLDVFAPCALGAILNDETIPQLRCTIVAGGANNQLADEEKHGAALMQRNILYAPDYVINAGGLINVAYELKGYNKEAAINEAQGIYQTLLGIFRESLQQGISTRQASDRLAERRIKSVRSVTGLRNTMDNQRWIQRPRAGKFLV